MLASVSTRVTESSGFELGSLAVPEQPGELAVVEPGWTLFKRNKSGTGPTSSLHLWCGLFAFFIFFFFLKGQIR